MAEALTPAFGISRKVSWQNPELFDMFRQLREDFPGFEESTSHFLDIESPSTIGNLRDTYPGYADLGLDQAKQLAAAAMPGSAYQDIVASLEQPDMYAHRGKGNIAIIGTSPQLVNERSGFRDHVQAVVDDEVAWGGRDMRTLIGRVGSFNPDHRIMEAMEEYLPMYVVLETLLIDRQPITDFIH